MPTVKVVLPPDEHADLSEVAANELRDPRAQAHIFIREGLRKARRRRTKQPLAATASAASPEPPGPRKARVVSHQ